MSTGQWVSAVRHPIPEDMAPLVQEAFRLMAKAFPGGIVVDTTKGGVCPELRVGPFRDKAGLWGVVKHADGRRAVTSLPDKAVLFKAVVTRSQEAFVDVDDDEAA